jgi:hypothetical protein
MRPEAEQARLMYRKLLDCADVECRCDAANPDESGLRYEILRRAHFLQRLLAQFSHQFSKARQIE